MDYLLNDDKSDNNLARKIFIFSNPEIFLLSCPPPCGHFLIQQSTAGGLSYKIKKAINSAHLQAPVPQLQKVSIQIPALYASLC